MGLPWKDSGGPAAHFVIPVLAAGTEVKYELSLGEHVSKTVQGVIYERPKAGIE